MKRYPSEAYNIFTGLAGVMMTINAYKNHYAKAYDPLIHSAESIRLNKREGLQDIGLGLTTFFACMYGLLVKEKKSDPDEPQPTGPLGKAVQYVRHNPLSVTGAGLMVSSAFHVASTATAWIDAVKTNNVKRKQSVPFRAGFVLVNLIGEILIMISSKGHGEGVTSDDTVHSTAYKMAAEVILSQPKEQREYMTNYIADFLEQPDVLAEKRTTVVQKLNEEIEKLKDNPWLCCHQNLTKAGEHMLLEEPTVTSKPKNWEEKVSITPPTDEQLTQPGLN